VYRAERASVAYVARVDDEGGECDRALIGFFFKRSALSFRTTKPRYLMDDTESFGCFFVLGVSLVKVFGGCKEFCIKARGQAPASPAQLSGSRCRPQAAPSVQFGLTERA
jgi:hypothetical protein